MNELPLEVLSSILDLISLKERLKLREVCKKFLLVIDGRPGKSLVIKEENDNFGSVWFDNREVVSSNNLIHCNLNVGMFDSNLFKSRFFVNLKKLHLSYSYIRADKENEVNIYLSDSYIPKLPELPEKQITFLNNFQQLETLYLYLPENLVLSRKAKIELQELKNLEITTRFYPQTSILKHHVSFDCPKLSFIKAKSFASFTIENPEKVTRITTWAREEVHFAHLERFVSLECLELQTFKFNAQHFKEFVSRLKHLKILGLPWPKTKNELIELKQSVEGWTIEVYVRGVHISRWDPQCWDDLDFLKFYLDNYQFHRFMVSFFGVNYTRLLEIVNDQIVNDQLSLPTNFKKGLVCLSKVLVTKKIDRVDKFIKFIANCKLLKMMFLKNSSLGDEFYSILPGYLPYLKVLYISDDEEHRISNTNFSFLLKLPLCHFETDYQLDLSLIRNLILNKTQMEVIKCLFEDQMIYVASLTHRPSEHQTTEDFHQLKQFEQELNEELERSSRKIIIIKRLINYQITFW